LIHFFHFLLEATTRRASFFKLFLACEATISQYGAVIFEIMHHVGSFS